MVVEHRQQANQPRTHNLLLIVSRHDLLQLDLRDVVAFAFDFELRGDPRCGCFGGYPEVACKSVDCVGLQVLA